MKNPQTKVWCSGKDTSHCYHVLAGDILLTIRRETRIAFVMPPMSGPKNAAVANTEAGELGGSGGTSGLKAIHAVVYTITREPTPSIIAAFHSSSCRNPRRSNNSLMGIPGLCVAYN